MIIYLYVKQHLVTKLKYFGKTIKVDPFKYTGSGRYWKSHLKKHGKEHVKTLEVWGFDDQDLCTKFALNFSRKNNIVESKEWANLCEENGLDGGVHGWKHTEESKQKIRNFMITYTHSEESKKKISQSKSGERHHLFGKNHSSATKSKMSKSQKEKDFIFSEESKSKMRIAKLGTKHSPETIKKISQYTQNMPDLQCPHCGHIGKGGAMKVWHFDKCKLNNSGR